MIVMLAKYFASTSLLTLVLAFLAPGFSLAAVHLNDFYCLEFPIFGQNLYFRRSALDCGSEKEASSEGICMMTVRCAYVSESTKIDMVEKYNPDHEDLNRRQKLKSFDALTEEQIVDFFKTEQRPDFIPSQVICPSVSPGICPPPDQCKKGIFHGVAAAVISRQTQMELTLRHSLGTTKVFRPAPDAPPVPAAPEGNAGSAGQPAPEGNAGSSK